MKWTSTCTAFLWGASEFRSMKMFIICEPHTKRWLLYRKRKGFFCTCQLLNSMDTKFRTKSDITGKEKMKCQFALDWNAFLNFKKDVTFSFLLFLIWGVFQKQNAVSYLGSCLWVSKSVALSHEITSNRDSWHSAFDNS